MSINRLSMMYSRYPCSLNDLHYHAIAGSPRFTDIKDIYRTAK